MASSQGEDREPQNGTHMSRPQSPFGGPREASRRRDGEEEGLERRRQALDTWEAKLRAVSKGLSSDKQHLISENERLAQEVAELQSLLASTRAEASALEAERNTFAHVIATYNPSRPRPLSLETNFPPSSAVQSSPSAHPSFLASSAPAASPRGQRTLLAVVLRFKERQLERPCASLYRYFARKATARPISIQWKTTHIPDSDAETDTLTALGMLPDTEIALQVKLPLGASLHSRTPPGSPAPMSPRPPPSSPPPTLRGDPVPDADPVPMSTQGDEPSKPPPAPPSSVTLRPTSPPPNRRRRRVTVTLTEQLLETATVATLWDMVTKQVGQRPNAILWDNVPFTELTQPLRDAGVSPGNIGLAVELPAPTP